jgi:hypothetical protein
MNKLYEELQLINEFEANYNPTTRSEKRKQEIFEQILKEYNE